MPEAIQKKKQKKNSNERASDRRTRTLIAPRRANCTSDPFDHLLAHVRHAGWLPRGLGNCALLSTRARCSACGHANERRERRCAITGPGRTSGGAYGAAVAHFGARRMGYSRFSRYQKRHKIRVSCVEFNDFHAR